MTANFSAAKIKNSVEVRKWWGCCQRNSTEGNIPLSPGSLNEMGKINYR